jgi:exopolyphosphatase/pppGpp-phosphohydrolase
MRRTALAWLLLTLLVAPAAARARGEQRGAGYRAVIDYGSSSAKMIIADPTGRVVLDVKQSTRLGQGVGRDRLLPQANRDRGLAALRSFVGLAQGYGIAPQEIDLFATAAMRNTTGQVTPRARAEHKQPGAAHLEQEIKGQLGFVKARILSGEQEAQLGYRGVLSGWPVERLARQLGKPVARVAVFDTGGDSNQCTVGSACGAIGASGSIQIGSHRVRQVMAEALGKDQETFSASDLQRADRKLARVMTRLPVRHAEVRGAVPLLTGGFGKFLRYHFGRDEVTRGEIEALRLELASMDLAQRGRFVRQQPGTRRLLGKEALAALGIQKPAEARSYGEALPAKATLMLRVLYLAGVRQPSDKVLLSDADSRHAVLGGAL